MFLKKIHVKFILWVLTLQILFFRAISSLTQKCNCSLIGLTVQSKMLGFLALMSLPVRGFPRRSLSLNFSRKITNNFSI